MDIGVEAAGFRVAVATDIDPFCAQTYQNNFPSVPFVTNRIGEVSAEDLLKAGGLKKGEVALLVGGPPCPAFSKSRFYRTDKPRALEDPVAAETVNGYLRILKEVRPAAFLLENVKGLAYGVHKEALDHILRVTESLGYQVAWRVINAADYGVPQIRERCLVMGSLYGHIEFPVATHSKGGLDESRAAWKTAGEALRDLDTDSNASDEGHFAGGKHHELLADIPPGENYLYYTRERGHPEPKFTWRSRYWSFLLKLSPELPSWTIQARRSNNMGPLHWRNRILRISEIKRLQGFPDDFSLAGSVERQWRQIGNAVPPLIAQRFAESILKHLEGSKREE